MQDCHDLLVWIIPKLDQFPRARRYSLGSRIETSLLDVLESLLEASYSSRANPPLKRASLKLNSLRHLWRVAFELTAINSKSFEYGARLIDDIGKQIGGWKKHQISKSENL